MKIGKSLCWVVTALLAPPASADEAPSREVTPPIAVDANALLLVDARTIARIAEHPAPDAAPGFGLTATSREFDLGVLDTPAATDLAAFTIGPTQALPGFAPVFDPPADGRRVAGELMPVAKARRRGATPLSAMLTLRIDGDAESPPVDLGGGAGALWNVIPR